MQLYKDNRNIWVSCHLPYSTPSVRNQSLANSSTPRNRIYPTACINSSSFSALSNSKEVQPTSLKLLHMPLFAFKMHLAFWNGQIRFNLAALVWFNGQWQGKKGCADIWGQSGQWCKYFWWKFIPHNNWSHSVKINPKRSSGFLFVNSYLITIVS